MSRTRLDTLVYEKGLAESREKAKTTVMSGLVYVNGQKADKPGMQVPEDAEIEVRGNACPFVSRGGYKLDKALKVFPIDAKDKVCLDCGASTGGFTDVLLKNGAKKVYAVDVGYGQLAWTLRNDPRVVNIERTNARYLNSDNIPETVDIAVTDVSFISVKLLLPAIIPLLAESGDIVCLIKPQFEAGRDQVGKKGVVRDPNVHISVIEDICAFAKMQGLRVEGLDYSPIKGPEGNIEYLCYMKKAESSGEAKIFDIPALVDSSHKKL